MKRFLAFLTIFGCIFLQAIALGAEEIPSDALRFKEEYELINGQMNLSGSHEYKTIEIPEENPFVFSVSQLACGTLICFVYMWVMAP